MASLLIHIDLAYFYCLLDLLPNVFGLLHRAVRLLGLPSMARLYQTVRQPRSHSVAVATDSTNDSLYIIAHAMHRWLWVEMVRG